MFRFSPVPCHSVRIAHPFDHETSSLRVRGNRRRALNFESCSESHFLPKRSSLSSPQEDR